MDEQRGIQCASNPLGVRQGPKAFLQTTLMKKHPVLKHYISFYLPRAPGAVDINYGGGITPHLMSRQTNTPVRMSEPTKKRKK
jgi:hypothetical protein